MNMSTILEGFDNLPPELRMHYDPFLDELECFSIPNKSVVIVNGRLDIWHKGLNTDWKKVKESGFWHPFNSDVMAIVNFVYNKPGHKDEPRRMIPLNSYVHKATFEPTVSALEITNLTQEEKNVLFECINDIFMSPDIDMLRWNAEMICGDVFKENFKNFHLRYVETQLVQEYDLPIENNIF